MNANFKPPLDYAPASIRKDARWGTVSSVWDWILLALAVTPWTVPILGFIFEGRAGAGAGVCGGFFLNAFVLICLIAPLFRETLSRLVMVALFVNLLGWAAYFVLIAFLMVGKW